MLIDLAPRSSSTDVRAANTQRVLDVLRSSANEWMTVRVLSEVSGISRPTVTRVCESLVEAGWAAVNEGVSQGVGRPAREFRFRAEHRSVATVILRPDEVRCQIGDLSGEALASHHQPGLDLTDPGAAAQAVADAVKRTQELAGTSTLPASLVCSVPGLVTPNGDIWTSVDAPGWVNSDLAHQVRRLLPSTRLSLANESHLAAQAELNHGTLRGVDSAIYLHSARSFDPVAIVGGRVYTGANGAAGTSGGFDLRPLLKGTLGLEELIFIHEGGDKVATERITEYIDATCHLVALLISAFDPSLVVFGGVLSKVRDIVAPRLERELATMLRRPPLLVNAGLSLDAAPLRGGLDLALAELDLEHIAAF